MSDTPAFIYKLTPYSDRSAVAYAFTQEFGRIKLFIKDAYTKRGAPLCNVPGSLSFSLKETSELHRFYSFMTSANFAEYTANQEIRLRLSVCFELFEQLFATNEKCPVFWKLLLKFDAKNYREVFLYTFYRLLREAGLWFFHRCRCGQGAGELYLFQGELCCENCLNEGEEGVNIKRETALILLSFADNDLYRQVELTAASEEDVLRLLEHFAETEAGVTLKSLKVFREISG